MSEVRAIWAGHAATPTIEERRAALRVGQVIKDPALLAKGMRVDVAPTRRGLTVGQPLVGATEAGSRCASDGMSIGGDWVRRAGVTFLGWAQEEKAGDEPVKLPCHLTMGTEPLCGARDIHFFQTTDVVDEADCPACLEIAKRAKPPADKPAHAPTGLTHLKRSALQRTWCGAPRDEKAAWTTASADCPACLAAIERPPEPRWERITFLGWDQEEPAIQAGDAVAMGPDGKLRKAGYTTAGKLDPRICDPGRCEFHHDPGDPACVRAKHRTPPRGLPFKRHPDCYMPSIHVVEVMCMGCEAAIAREATDADRNAAHERALQPPSRVDACPPSPSGLGGTVGPVLSRLR